MRNRTILFASMLVSASMLTVGADTVSLIPVPGYSTGANASALAGPLLSSTLMSVDISGPGPGFAIAAKDGNTATHDFSVELDFSGGPAFFDSTYFGTFGRTAMPTHRASAESIYHFAVDVPTVFSVMGFFAAIDALGTTIPGNVELEIELLEFDSFGPLSPPPTTLFYSYQASHMTMDESFVVGGTGGDFASVLAGSPVGLMAPGKFYRYRTLVTINAIDPDGAGPMLPTNGAATASGAHTIVFSKAIPEPYSLSLMLLAGICLVSRRIRNRKQLV